MFYHASNIADSLDKIKKLVFREYEKAATVYSEFAARFPDSYDAPIAIYNTGVCYENLGSRICGGSESDAGVVC